jgi:hypothetical protein
MKNIILFFVSIALTATSCDKNNTSKEDSTPTYCGVIDPVKNLKWLNELIGGSSCQIYPGAKVYSYSYNGENIFWFTNPASSIGNCTSELYDCAGTKVTVDNWNDFEKNRTAEKLLWSK